ncbi:MAG: T9SS type A sorting domain-containing protein, partial [Bacteroidia bacterium]|nr:T9SS type A sorting domain-containing protein [Bacteroidia bacterium]
RLIQSGSDGVFIISGEQILNGKMEFTVYSTSGKIQIHDFSDNSERKIDLSQLPEGIYFVAIRTNDGVYSQKILR